MPKLLEKLKFAKASSNRRDFSISKRKILRLTSLLWIKHIIDSNFEDESYKIKPISKSDLSVIKKVLPTNFYKSKIEEFSQIGGLGLEINYKSEKNKM